MARISGVDLPREKRIEAGLQYIYGVGPHRAGILLKSTNINPDTRVRELTEEQVSALQNAIQASFKVEGDLRRETTLAIKRLMDINSYRGQRHKKGLPLRGQRTRTNARTRKGPRRMAVTKKKTS